MLLLIRCPLICRVHGVCYNNSNIHPSFFSQGMRKCLTMCIAEQSDGNAAINLGDEIEANLTGVISLPFHSSAVNENRTWRLYTAWTLLSRRIIGSLRAPSSIWSKIGNIWTFWLWLGHFLVVDQIKRSTALNPASNKNLQNRYSMTSWITMQRSETLHLHAKLTSASFSVKYKRRG